MFTDAPIGVMPHAPAARRRSAETWEAAKAAYLSGESGPQVCERFDVGLSALRQRAAREDWRRADQNDPAPREPAREATPEELDADPPLDAAEMAELARKRARRAMLEGKVRDAQTWTRVCETWRRLAAEDAAAARQAALDAETPEETFARRKTRRDHDERLSALDHADWIARRAAATDDDDDEDLHDLHDRHEAPDEDVSRDMYDLHEVHSGLETKASGSGALNRHCRLAQARMEAFKARQAARDGP